MPTPVDRRSWLKNVAVLGAAGGLRPRASAAEDDSAARPNAGSPTVTSSRSTTVAETASGKVQGYLRAGIFTFKGIPYGAPAGGARRFLPPAKPKSWRGVRSSLCYGPACPQARRDAWDKDTVAWVYAWSDSLQDEDCLRVNVWTPGINDSRHRPVMLWLHGGGFNGGCGNDMNAYDGENLARRGDVVVVSLNHRIGVLGFLDLSSAGGEQYGVSGTVGMLDIVAALEWVRDNIANFGGDPRSVTLFGQSGGGAKINVLMAMPRAKGLFHRAIVQSGPMHRMVTQEQAAKLTTAVLNELNISKASLAALQTLPVERIVAAGEAAAKKVYVSPDWSKPFDHRRFFEVYRWAPVVDGNILPEHPFWEHAPAISAHVPMIVGSTFHEIAPGFEWLTFDDMTESALLATMTKAHGPQAGPRVHEEFRRGHPGAKPAERWCLWFSAGYRRAAIRQAAFKAAQGGAPAYLYWFGWQTPVLDGRLHAFHCSELPFVFDNTGRCENATGGGPGPRDLAAKMSAAWIQFARTGNPNHPELLKWPAFTDASRSTMIFDNQCRVENNPDGNEIQAVATALGWS